MTDRRVKSQVLSAYERRTVQRRVDTNTREWVDNNNAMLLNAGLIMRRIIRYDKPEVVETPVERSTKMAVKSILRVYPSDIEGKGENEIFKMLNQKWNCMKNDVMGRIKRIVKVKQ